MITYKDMTFCASSSKCKHEEECPRALTEEVFKVAKEIGLPVSTFLVIPQCFIGKEQENV